MIYRSENGYFGNFSGTGIGKKFTNVDPHGYEGDFYQCGEHIYRADNLMIATQIGFNHFLFDFDNFHRSCKLESLEPGRFTVSIFGHPGNSPFARSLGTEEHLVTYHGPANMFTEAYQQDACKDPEFISMLNAMKEALAEGNPAVRLAKSSGRVIFSEQTVAKFPRFRPDLPEDDDENWFPSCPYLSTDIEIARLQMQYANIIN